MTSAVAPQRVLVVDDEPRMAELVRFALEAQGLEVLTAPDADRAWQLICSTPLDLVVLDVMMPGESGLELCGRIRQVSRLPIIMLTARGDTGDRVVGLEAGADDYVAKPFSPRELALRVRAVLRRRSAAPAEVTHQVTVGELTIDLHRLRASRKGKDLHLTPGEFRILVTLSDHLGRTVGWQALFEAMAGEESTTGGRRAVKTAVYRLRAKLGDDPRAPRYILTDRGVGYRLTRGD